MRGASTLRGNCYKVKLIWLNAWMLRCLLVVAHPIPLSHPIKYPETHLQYCSGSDCPFHLCVWVSLLSVLGVSRHLRSETTLPGLDIVSKPQLCPLLTARRIVVSISN